MPQIISITSEALQATIRRLLPSQQGFGEDLQASNVVTPIIDLTPTAEGSALPVDLARALSFGSQTAFKANNSTDVIANTAGFHLITAAVLHTCTAAATRSASFTMSDGLSTKTIWELENPGFIEQTMAVNVELTVFLDSGESISAVTNNADSTIAGSVRQIADISGDIVNPSGFVSQ